MTCDCRTTFLSYTDPAGHGRIARVRSVCTAHAGEARAVRAYAAALVRAWQRRAAAKALPAPRALLTRDVPA